MRDLPSLILGLTVAAYWTCVGVMIVRVGRRTRKIRRIVIPPDRLERRLWIVWMPLVALWIALPFVARTQDPSRHPFVALPAMIVSNALVTGLRYAAAAGAVICLAASIRCWRHMGRDWRMGVESQDAQRLITNGPFAWVRHPIYSLSLGLMACTVVAVPTPLMMIVGFVHASLLFVKARHEEAALRETHGTAYEEYCRQTGRFLPRLGSSR